VLAAANDPLLVRGGEGEEGRSAVQGVHVRNIISENSPQGRGRDEGKSMPRSPHSRLSEPERG
jgi:hypothetical protein